MGTLTRKAFDRKAMPEYPFDIGYRWVKNGSAMTQVPLTEEDFLHPQEEDRFLLTDAHTTAIDTVKHALRWNRGDEAFRVFSDHRIDFQVADVLPMGPDVIAFGRFEVDWDPNEGTVPVEDLGVETLMVAEMTSQSTRHIDLGRKVELYFRAGVPYYLIFDIHAGEDRNESEVIGYRATRKGYVRMKENPDYGVWVPTVGLWFKFDDYEAVIHTADKVRVPSSKDETKRADAAELRADAAELRADALEKELADLRAKLANQPTKKNGHK